MATRKFPTEEKKQRDRKRLGGGGGHEIEKKHIPTIERHKQRSNQQQMIRQENAQATHTQK
jgi:hypothetical protein